MVQLKDLSSADALVMFNIFQFLHGTIKSLEEAKEAQPEIDFNSFMVQLKGSLS